jgi:hypothetical protein
MRRQDVPRAKLDCPQAAAAAAVLTARINQTAPGSTPGQQRHSQTCWQIHSLALPSTHQTLTRHTRHTHTHTTSCSCPQMQQGAVPGVNPLEKLGLQSGTLSAQKVLKSPGEHPQACGCSTQSSRRSLSTGPPKRQPQQTTRTTACVSGPRQQPLQALQHATLRATHTVKTT